MDIKEKTLSMALSDVRCHELPKLYREDDLEGKVWIKAIALVKKRNLVQTYMLAEHKADGRIIYTKDYASSIGNVSPMAGLIGVYPYVYLDTERYMSKVNLKTDMCAIISSVTGRKYEDLYEMSVSELIPMYRQYVIDSQLKDSEAGNFNKIAEEEIMEAIGNKKISFTEEKISAESVS